MRENALIKSLHTDYARSLTKNFFKAVEDYRLIKSGDRVFVSVFGDSPSLLLAALLRDYKRHGGVSFEVSYRAENACAGEFLNSLGISAECLENAAAGESAFDSAARLGCNKIALESHFDDVIEDTLCGMIYGGEARIMLPRERAKKGGIELIRPLYLVRERDITAWQSANRLACEERRSDDPARKLVKELIARLSEGNPQVPQNIFRSVHNVRLDHIISYNDGICEHTFLENYER